MRKISGFIFLCFILSALSCRVFSLDSAPYLIDGEMTLETSSKYEIAGFNFYFLNKADKAVKDFTLVFYLFDEDGNPLSFGKNNIVAKVNVPLAAGEGINGCISLDPFLFEIPDYEYEVDYLYVSLITYEDDSIWSDPFGLCKL